MLCCDAAVLDRCEAEVIAVKHDADVFLLRSLFFGCATLDIFEDAFVACFNELSRLLGPFEKSGCLEFDDHIVIACVFSPTLGIDIDAGCSGQSLYDRSSDLFFGTPLSGVLFKFCVCLSESLRVLNLAV